jgi:alginate O-acetyltransferase complex protein AlgI
MVPVVVVFSSPIFLFLFLPVVLTGYFLLPGIRAKNLGLLGASLLFYAWGEPLFLGLLFASTWMNYRLGIWVDVATEPRKRKLAVTLAIVLNLGLLAFFKYANLAAHTVNAALGWANVAPLPVPHIVLPIGISFFTFHALSYVIDIYRRKVAAARRLSDTGLYIFLFPQLIAGPILRWSAMAPQFAARVVTREGFAEGIRRFIGGLAKKMIVANTVALPADNIFALSATELTTPVAWFGVLCYTLQIYFDFSAYSDMAVGLGKMFGFKFLENFDYPYISTSVREFWRRWHISLSSWFRDYLYIPMGGNRVSERRNYFNLVTVFALCGFWHGASWAFVIWGLYHGLFLVLERTRFGKLVDRLPRPVGHFYALLVVMCGWVLFRSDTLAQAGWFFKTMSGFAAATEAGHPLGRYVSNQVLSAIVLGGIFSGPTWPRLKAWLAKLPDLAPAAIRPALRATGRLAEIILLAALLLVCAAWLAGGTYNPFIYYRF